MDDIGCLTATALKSSVAVRKATCRIPSEAVRKCSILFVRNIGEVYARRIWDKTHKHRLGYSSISMIFYILRNYGHVHYSHILAINLIVVIYM